MTTNVVAFLLNKHGRQAIAMIESDRTSRPPGVLLRAHCTLARTIPIVT